MTSRMQRAMPALSCAVMASSAAACAQVAGIDTLAPAVDGTRGGAFCSAEPRPTSTDALFFCDDFDQGNLPAPWQSAHAVGGTLSVGTEAARSSPDSLDLAVGALGSNQAVNVALRSAFEAPPLPSTVTFAFSVDPVRIDATEHASMVLAALDFLDSAGDRYTVQLAFDVQGGAPAVVLDELYSNGTPYVPHALSQSLTVGAFTDISLVIAWRSATGAAATLTMNGNDVLDLPLATNVDASNLAITLGTTYSTEPSSGWEVRYDDVLFTAQ